jgi:thiosulfate dehydrogenase
MPPFPRYAPLLVALAVLAPAAAAAAATGDSPPPPRTLRQAVDDGAALFAHARFGSTRSYTPLDGFNPRPLTCEACHSAGGVGPGHTPSGMTLPSLQGAAARFPQLRGGHVVTLEQQIAHCIAGGLGGQPPAAGSAAMTDLVAYLSALSRGRPFAPQLPAPPR